MLSDFPFSFQNLIQLLILLRKIHPSDITSPIFVLLDVVSMYTPLDTKNSNLKNHVSKGILFVYDTHNTRNLLYYDVDTHIIKLSSHVRFDEVMNDLPIEDTPLNVQHIQRVDDGQPPPMITYTYCDYPG